MVRTRRVRAIDERFYGRTARLFRVGAVDRPGGAAPFFALNPLTHAGAEAEPAHHADVLAATVRHARISDEQAKEFWERVVALAQEFVRLPRAGDTTYGFAVGLYPIEHPTLPDGDAVDR